MHTRIPWWVAAWAPCLVVLAGCPNGKQPPQVYTTEPMAAVIEKINRNNLALPSLYSDLYFETTIYDEKGASHFVNGGGYLMLLKPDDLLFVGKKEGFGDVFEIGSTQERYWLIVRSELDTMWWGLRGQPVPADSQMPIPPEQLLDVLGTGDINTNLGAPPVPVLRYNNEADAYMFVWSARAPDRWYAIKEVWYDRATLLPTLVILFDQDGRAVMRARLSNHKPVKVEGVAESQWPKVATMVNLYVPPRPQNPKARSLMTIELKEPVLKNRKGFPRPGAIQFPNEPGVGKVVKVGQ